MFQRLFCLFGHHQLDRGRVREFGGDFFGSCRGCHAPMFRDQAGWRLSTPEEIREADERKRISRS